MLLTCLGLTCLAGPGLALGAEILHKERSLYSNVMVTRAGNTLCLLFNVRSNRRNQSCMDTKYPKKMIFAYTKMSMVSLLFAPDPQHILVIGLGGGTLPTAFNQLYPQARIDVVEIDPAVTRVARDYFAFNPTSHVKVFDQDARVWTKRANLLDRRYDIIILDAFNGEYIPEHLMTQQYLEETKSLLTANGVLVANTFSISDLYDHESATYAAVFGKFINFKIPESANRMVVVPGKSVPEEQLLTRANALRNTLAPYNVPIRRYSRILIRQRDRRPDWDPAARPLTDQFAPANLLQSQ